MSDPSPLIICEPSAVQAAQIAKGYDIVPYPANGALLKDRKVILWPDATPESRAAFKTLAESITDLCSELKIIVPNGRPHGWNIATAVAAGDSWDVIAKWARVSMIAFERGALAIETHDAPDPVPASVEAMWEECGLARNKSGIIYNVDNVVRLLSHWSAFKDMVWYDEFYGRYFTMQPKLREWGDIDDINLAVLLQHEYGLTKLRTATVSEAIQCRGHQCKRNEPKEWLSNLKWDGKSRIANFFPDCLGTASTPFHYAVGFNFWLGMVARIYQPGCQMDNMVILEGKQGIYKSKALEAIGGKWYMEASEELTSKDFFVALAGKLLIELADLDSFSRADTTRIKKVITCRVDRYRQPYGRASQDHPRQSVFVGTTNEQHYLKDNTGARRFWPIQCGKIDLDRISRDREQLFAEAVTQYIAGEPWHLMPAEATLLEQESRRTYDEWENIIQEFLLGKNEITLTELAAYMGFEKSKIDINSQRRMGSILRRCQWVNKNVRRGLGVVKLWVPLVSGVGADGSGPLPSAVPVPLEPVTD